MRHQGNPGKLPDLKIVIPLTVGFISLLISIILIASYVVNMDKETDKNSRNILNFIVATLSASATITGTFYVGHSIRQSVESEELDRTLSYMERWNNSHYSSFKKVAYQIHLLVRNQPDNQKGKIVREQIEKDDDLKMEVTEVLNFLEELALCINKGLIKEDLALGFYRYIVIRYYEIFFVWIAQLRDETKNDNQYKELTTLYDKWKNI